MNLNDIKDSIQHNHETATETECDMREDDNWLNQLVALINGEINHYMSQGMDYFSVDCGPWHIRYDNTTGRAE